MNSDGSEQTRLTSDDTIVDVPAWSPDGTKIVFVSRRDVNLNIHVMNADGSGQTRITNNDVQDVDPDWSPDGTKIAYSSLKTSWGIYVMNLDGSGGTRLTNTNANSFAPAWSPDGTEIAFDSNHRSEGALIYVMNADGSGQTFLTGIEYVSPDWSPAIFPHTPTGLQKITSERDPTPTFIWNAMPSTQSYEVQFDGGSWENIGATTTATASNSLSIGDHTIAVRAIAVTGFAGSATSSMFEVTKPPSILCRYDLNNSGTTQRGEAVSAVTDYLLGQEGGSPPMPITRPDAVEVVTAYLLQLTFACP
jgi:hypothetical protein